MQGNGRREDKRVDEINGIIRDQIKLLAKISNNENTTTSEVIECSAVMGDLYRSLNQG